MEPFGFRNFQATTFRLERYDRMIMDEGPSWIGCRYSPPITCYPLEVYENDYEICKKREDYAFEEIKGNHGF
jgi:hypothetical protein